MRSAADTMAVAADHSDDIVVGIQGLTVVLGVAAAVMGGRYAQAMATKAAATVRGAWATRQATVAELAAARAEVVYRAAMVQAVYGIAHKTAAVEGLRAAQLRLAAAEAATLTTTRALNGVFARTVAFFGGPVGLAVTGLTVGLGYLATSQSAAEKAAEKHAATLARLRAEADGTADAVGKINDKWRGVEINASQTKIGDYKEELRRIREEIGTEARRFDARGHGMAGGHKAELELANLKYQFGRSEIAADDLALKLGKLAETAPASVKAKIEETRTALESYRAVLIDIAEEQGKIERLRGGNVPPKGDGKGTGKAEGKDLAAPGHQAVADLARRAAAQERLAEAAGKGVRAQEAAARANYLADAAARHLGVDLDKLGATYDRLHAAKRKTEEGTMVLELTRSAEAAHAFAVATGEGEEALREYAIQAELTKMKNKEFSEESLRNAEARLRATAAANRQADEAATLRGLERAAKDARALADATIQGGRALEEHGIQTKLEEQRLKGYSEATVVASEAQLRLAAAEKRRMDAHRMLQGVSGNAAYAAEIANIKALEAELRSLGATEEEITRLYVQAERRRLEASRDASDGIQRALMDIRDASADAARQWENDIKGMNQTARTAFVDIMTGAKTMKEGLVGILEDLQRRILGRMYDRTIGSLADGLLDMVFSAKGNVFQGGELVPFARGGVVTAPTIFPMARGMGLMGEAGPEAVLPLTRLPGGDLGVKAQGGNGQGATTVINYSVYAPGSKMGREEFRALLREEEPTLTRRIVREARASVDDERSRNPNYLD